MQQYRDLLTTVLSEGTNKPNRTGEGTIASFGHSYKIDLRDGFPLLTGKTVNFDNILFELLWFLSGDSSVDWLHKHKITFWDPWIENGRYLPEAYGKFWRQFPVDENYWTDGCREEQSGEWTFDQFAKIINLLKNDPNNRRLVLTNWYPPAAYAAKLPPCHLLSIFNVQYDDDSDPYLNLHMTQRSCDLPVGVPLNIASYALLLALVSHLTQIKPRYFHHTLVDAHIYNNQIKGVFEYQERELRPLPKLMIHGFDTLDQLDLIIKHGTTDDIKSCFTLIDYNPHPFIKFPVMV